MAHLVAHALAIGPRARPALCAPRAPLLGLVSLLAPLAAATSGCRDHASCEDAVKNVARISGKTMDAEATERAVKECRESRMDRDLVDCVAGARDKAALARCQPRGAEQRLLKAKAAEATIHLRAIALGARSYYEEEHVVPGSLLDAPRQFPASAGPTPAPGSCCQGDRRRCAPRREDWEVSGWTALRFALSDPHYCWYQFESAGTGTDARFTARAHCDLDCDGESSTFELVGRATATGEVELADTVTKDRETE